MGFYLVFTDEDVKNPRDSCMGLLLSLPPGVPINCLFTGVPSLGRFRRMLGRGDVAFLLDAPASNDCPLDNVVLTVIVSATPECISPASELETATVRRSCFLSLTKVHNRNTINKFIANDVNFDIHL